MGVTAIVPCQVGEPYGKKLGCNIPVINYCSLFYTQKLGYNIPVINEFSLFTLIVNFFQLLAFKIFFPLCRKPFSINIGTIGSFLYEWTNIVTGTTLSIVCVYVCIQFGSTLS